MEKGKLTLLLKSVNKTELKAIQKFVSSTFFNTDNEIVDLFNYLQTCSPDFPNEKLEKKVVWDGIKPGEEFDIKKLSYIQSDLVDLIEKYLAYKSFRSNPILSLYYNSITFVDFGLEKEYRKSEKEARKYQRSRQRESPNFYYDEFLIESASNYFFDREKKRQQDQSLSKALLNLDAYYFSTKLKYTCELVNRSNVVGTDQAVDAEQVLKSVRESTNRGIPLIVAYTSILNMLVNPDDEDHFFKLMDMLEEGKSSFPDDELKDIYSYAQNYCIKRVNTGDSNFLSELFRIYKGTIETGVVMTGKYLSPWTYKNITGVALQLKEYQWAENFIEDYQDKLIPEYRKGALAYNKANLSFHKGEFRSALKLLQLVEFRDPYYYLDTKTMMMKIYFEQNDVVIFQLFESIKTYLYRNKSVSEYMRRSYRNLLKYTEIIARYKFNNYNPPEDLSVRIARTKYINNVAWLLEKAKSINK